MAGHRFDPFAGLNQPHFEIIGIEWKALTKQIEAAIETIQQAIAGFRSKSQAQTA